MNSRLSVRDVFNYYFYFTFPAVRINLLQRRIKNIKKEFRIYLDDHLIYEYGKASRNIFDLQKMEITKTQLRSLLNYEDKNSMAWSVETRLPFLDYHTVEAAISIKPSLKIHDGWSKFLLRRISSGVLPFEISWRKNKIGFEAPDSFDKILDQFDHITNSSKLINGIFDDASKIKDTKMRWKLLTIALWEKRFGMELP